MIEKSRATVTVLRYPRINDLDSWCLVKIPYEHRQIAKDLGGEWSRWSKTWFIWTWRLPELTERCEAAGLTVWVTESR